MSGRPKSRRQKDEVADQSRQVKLQCEWPVEVAPSVSYDEQKYCYEQLKGSYSGIWQSNVVDAIGSREHSLDPRARVWALGGQSNCIYGLFLDSAFKDRPAAHGQMSMLEMEV